MEMQRMHQSSPQLSECLWWEKPAANDECASGREYYYRARYYDPVAGRFLSEDPLGFEAGVNFYAYVGNNPLNFNDPMGLFNTSPIPHELFTQTIPNFIEGVFSVPVGVGRDIDFYTRFNGLQGQSEQTSAQFENTIFNQMASFAIDNPNLVFDLATQFAQNNPALVAGRAVTGAGVSFFTNPVAGFGVGAMAIEGDIRSAIESGVNSFEGLIPAAVGGRIDLNFNSSNFSLGSGASGGFVLYPNKINTNMTTSVYSK